MISTAYVAHYNAPKFWNELKDQSMPRYNTVVASAFGFALCIYLAVMWTGFLTFGGNSKGFLLNNYASSDRFATFARLAIGAGILFGYPLTFSALREGVMDVLKIPDGAPRDKATTPLTIIMLGAITSLALVLKNVGLVVAFGGALIGAMLIYFVPAVMNINNIKFEAEKAWENDAKKRRRRDVSPSWSLSRAQQAELVSNYGMAAMGVIIAIIGVTTTILGASGH